VCETVPMVPEILHAKYDAEHQGRHSQTEFGNEKFDPWSPNLQIWPLLVPNEDVGNEKIEKWWVSASLLPTLRSLKKTYRGLLQFIPIIQTRFKIWFQFFTSDRQRIGCSIHCSPSILCNFFYRVTF